MEPAAHKKSALRITAAAAAGLVKSGDWVDYGAILSQPDEFDRALAARKSELRDVKIRACLSLRPRAGPAARAFSVVQLALRWLRPEEARRGTLPLYSVQPRRNSGLLPPLHRA